VPAILLTARPRRRAIRYRRSNFAARKIPAKRHEEENIPAPRRGSDQPYLAHFVGDALLG
jgi:hypothetical protein